MWDISAMRTGSKLSDFSGMENPTLTYTDQQSGCSAQRKATISPSLGQERCCIAGRHGIAT